MCWWNCSALPDLCKMRATFREAKTSPRSVGSKISIVLKIRQIYIRALVLLEKFLYQFWMGFCLLTHKCHWPAKHQHLNQVQSDSLPNVSGDVTSVTQKMLKKGICKRHLVKWQVVPSREFTYSIFLKCFEQHHFFQQTSSF